jgi:hypothetical protein
MRNQVRGVGILSSLIWHRLRLAVALVLVVG